jgi:hypothetical protein
VTAHKGSDSTQLAKTVFLEGKVRFADFIEDFDGELGDFVAEDQRGELLMY